LNYLLDANTYIQAKNDYYRMEICPAYWEWLDRQFSDANLASVSLVYEELKTFGDELSEWVKARKSHFVDVSDDATQNRFSEIAEYAAGIAGVAPASLGDFLQGADPWLIAKAKVLGATVVTQEVLAPASSRKIKIPNVCRRFGVEYLNTFQLLGDLKARFVLEN